MNPEAGDLREQVRARYAAAALAVTAARPEDAIGDEMLCASPCRETPDAWGEGTFGATLYPNADAATVPPDALAASLGCGIPTAVAGLRAGETVLDLGSGGGIDVLLSAGRVGPTGKAYGLDMTVEMLELARANAAAAGAANVEFLQGHIEAIPLPDNSVDVVISNCVINLSVDKAAVFGEMFRVLKPGGRIGVSDLVADDGVTVDERAARSGIAGCVALSFTEYREQLAAAGFSDVTITATHPVADGLHAATVAALRPPAAR